MKRLVAGTEVEKEKSKNLWRNGGKKNG